LIESSLSVANHPFRTGIERRCAVDRRGLSLPEHLFKIIVECGGGVYRGVQPGYYSLGLEPLVLFDGPSRATLCLTVPELSASSVRSAIEKKEAEFSNHAV